MSRASEKALAGARKTLREGGISAEAPADILAELGITFLLFSIGLELKLDRFRLYGWRTYALAVAQMIVTATVLAVAITIKTLAVHVLAYIQTFPNTANPRDLTAFAAAYRCCNYKN